MRTLPDLLRPGLDLVFVGINPGEESARQGHYYAHPGNGFWPALSASGLVSRAVTCEDDRALAEEAGIGFTDVVKRVVTDSTQITDAELRASLAAFRARIAYARPRVVCFTTTRGFAACFPGVRTPNAWGRQTASIGSAEVWLMPSTSGRAVAHRAHVHAVLAELASMLRGARADRGAA